MSVDVAFVVFGAVLGGSIVGGACIIASAIDAAIRRTEGSSRELAEAQKYLAKRIEDYIEHQWHRVH